MKKIALGILFTFLVAGSGLTFATVVASNTNSVEVLEGLSDKDKDKKKKKCCATKEGDKKKCCSSEKKTEGEQKPAEQAK